MHPWTPLPGNQDPMDGGYPYRGMMPSHDLDDFSKIETVPVLNTHPYGGAHANSGIVSLTDLVIFY